MSNEARLLQRHFLDRGIDSLIYAEHIQDQVRDDAVSVRQFFRRPPPDVVIYHYGIGTPITRELRRWPGAKVLVYHNVTPAHYFYGVNEEMARLCEQGRQDLAGERRRYRSVWACSEFSRRELLAIGFEQVRHVPVPIAWSDYNCEPDRATLRALENKGGPHILFVGRISVNKRQDDIVRAFAAYRNLYEPSAHLWLVGTPVGQERYLAQIQALVETLRLGSHVHIVGHTSFAELVAFYTGTHMFLSMSEHEGLGIPWLEAMYFGLPVLAYSAAALPETIADGGILFTQKDFELVAALMHRTVTNAALREQLIAAGRRRALDFSVDRVLPMALAYLAEDIPELGSCLV
jgi:glycosyltransferase involved in cell wall biosynthesis